MQALRGGRLQSWDGQGVPGHRRQNLGQRSVCVAVINLVPAPGPPHFPRRVRASPLQGMRTTPSTLLLPPRPHPTPTPTTTLVGFCSIESRVWVDFRSSFFSPSLTFPPSFNLFSGQEGKIETRGI